MSEDAPDPRRGTEFSLSYELRPEDLQQLVSSRARAKRKDLRTRAVFGIILMGILAAFLTAFTAALDLTSAAKGSSPAPSWMYAVDVILWCLVFFYVRAAWRLSPKRMARRAWEESPQAHGRHRDLVDQAGLTGIGPDGAWGMVPWATLSQVDENGDAFKLIDHDGETRAVLPKRGLAHPGSIPALREFLNRSVAARSAAPVKAAPETRAEHRPGAHGETGFSLAYELQPGDVLAVNREQLKQHRERSEASIAASGLGAAFFAWQTVGHGSSAAPGWMYVAGSVFVLHFLHSLAKMWRLSPRRYARRAFQRSVERHGTNVDLVQPPGVIAIEPDGDRHGIPWSAVDKVEETDDTFRLVDRHGVVRKVLFKRAVPRPDLVPALRDFIESSVAASRAATRPYPGDAMKQP
jgi:hypothetical protein